MSTRLDRWQSLVHASFLLDSSPRAPVAETAALVEHVLEVFGPSIDPVEDFEGYAVRRFALAVREALAREAARAPALRTEG
jgi:hypothetical protein